MASLVVAGDVSGSVTLSAPSAAGSTVITLPTTSGTMVVTGGAQTVQFAAGSAASPSITFTGDTNTGIFSPTADTIAFSEGGVESMRIDTSGNVGIGTASPAAKVEISGTAAASNLALRITNTATDGYSTLQMGGGDAGIYRNGSAQSGYAGASSLNLITVGAHAIGLATGNTIRAIIPAAGGVQAVTTISVGNATPAASGAGITFPATQSASSNANTLDDYEEGTFTPTIVGTATAGTASYTNQVGEYTKIGNLVYFQINIFWSSGTGTGDLRIAGLPFTVKNNNIFPGVSLGYFNDVSFAANSSILALLESNNTRIYFYSVPSGGGNNVQVAYDAAGFIIVAGSYTT